MMRSGKRIAGLLLIFIAVAPLLFGVLAMVSPPASSRFDPIPYVSLAIGLALLVGGIALLKAAGETAESAAASLTLNPDEKTGRERAKVVSGLAGLAALAFCAWWYLGGGLESDVNRRMSDIHNQVAADAVTQYGIAKRNGTAMDACVRAGLVAEAYLQAKDEAQYQQWKQTEKADCAKAGIQK
jgi:hypothetical protein